MSFTSYSSSDNGSIYSQDILPTVSHKYHADPWKLFKHYERVNFKPTLLEPPVKAYTVPSCHQSTHKAVERPLPRITDEEATDAFLSKIYHQCCWGRSVPDSMEVDSILHSHVFHYKLDTFCEKRRVACKEVPYCGGDIDGIDNGSPPPPWEIHDKPNEDFQDHKHQIHVPHTEQIRTCDRCQGRLLVQCSACRAYGKTECQRCEGTGKHGLRHTDGMWEHRVCYLCNGRGIDICSVCGGGGHVTCPQCHGKGQVKTYIELTISYKNHTSNNVVGNEDLPFNLVNNQQAVEIYKKTELQASPLIGLSTDIYTKSEVAIKGHQEAFPSERIVKQRQTVSAIPLTQVLYTWMGQRHYFCVYGSQRRCWCPDYPQKRFCGCTIL